LEPPTSRLPETADELIAAGAETVGEGEAQQVAIKLSGDWLFELLGEVKSLGGTHPPVFAFDNGPPLSLMSGVPVDITVPVTSYDAAKALFDLHADAGWDIGPGTIPQYLRSRFIENPHDSGGTTSLAEAQPATVTLTTIDGQWHEIRISDVAFIAHGRQRRGHEPGPQHFTRWFVGTTVGLDSGQLLDISEGPNPDPELLPGDLREAALSFVGWTASARGDRERDVQVLAKPSSVTAMVPGRFTIVPTGFAIVAGHEFDFGVGPGDEQVERVFAGREVDRLQVDLGRPHTRLAAFSHEYWGDEAIVSDASAAVKVAGNWVKTDLGVNTVREVKRATLEAVSRQYGIVIPPANPPSPGVGGIGAR
jgi:hypothetical protein